MKRSMNKKIALIKLWIKKRASVFEIFVSSKYFFMMFITLIDKYILSYSSI